MTMERISDFLVFIWNYLLTVVMTVSIWDILDILIVAYLIYRLLTLVRRTSSGRVIRGIMLLIVVIWLSSLLQLNMLNFILGQAMEMGILVIIILFQPELRRFLEQFGSRSLSGLFGKQYKLADLEASIGQTVIACEAMSKSKIGALIVFERDIRLDDKIRTGTTLDAETTAELLKNIFFPNTALHDGAVIIRNGRIMAAGCVLPTSDSPNISKDLGMRHRAAIGMSAESDAVCVVVSEETGSISVAVGGMLKRHLAVDTFEKLLRNELITDTEKSRFKRFTDRLKVKDNVQ